MFEIMQQQAALLDVITRLMVIQIGLLSVMVVIMWVKK